MKKKIVKKGLLPYAPNSVDAFAATKEVFENFGYTVLQKPAPQDIDSDMYVVGKKACITVEIKKARKIQTGAWQAAAISIRQKKCDVVSVVFDSGYVFLEHMDDYIQHCSPSGVRSFTWLKLDGMPAE